MGLPTAEDGIVARLEPAVRALAECRDAKDAKRVADLARAAEVYARRQKLSEEAIAYATAVKVDAMTLMGEMLKATPKNTGGGDGSNQHKRATGSKKEPVAAAPTYAQAGIGKKEASDAQALATIRERAPDLHERVRAGEVTIAKARKVFTRTAAERKPHAPPADDAESYYVKDLSVLVARGDRYGTIYADPPWQYGNQGTRAATDNHYPTMTLEELAALPVADLAADKSHLHLWTTNGFLEAALGLLRGWGFEFKSTFVWVKPQLGIGNYWRCSHEIMLLGVRGGLTFPPNGIPSWLEAARRRHSEKPGRVRDLIEMMSPGPRLEMFARTTARGWMAFGNEDPPRRNLFDPDPQEVS